MFERASLTGGRCVCSEDKKMFARLRTTIPSRLFQHRRMFERSGPSLYRYVFVLKRLSTPPDGLVDCMDPDCCTQTPCHPQSYSQGSPDPDPPAARDPAAPSSPHTASRSFYDHVSFLVGPGGTHVLPGDNPFNSRSVTSTRTAWSSFYCDVGIFL